MDIKNLKILIIVIIFILAITFTLINIINSKKKYIETKKILEADTYDGFVSNSDLVNKLNNNNTINKIGNFGFSNNKSTWNKIFDNARNPWGITPTIFKALRISSVILGVIIALLIFIFTGKIAFSMFGIFISLLGWFYPSYYYKTVAKEREEEWDKIYEFIWLIKHTAMLYDAKKVCIETKIYIENHSPQYKEIIRGFSDFNLYWNEETIPEEILRFYNFGIPKELYKILFNMNITGTIPDQNLDNLRSFALNKHNGLIQRVLSNIASLATLASLPFLMLSLVVCLLIPMVLSFMKLM